MAAGEEVEDRQEAVKREVGVCCDRPKTEADGEEYRNVGGAFSFL